MNKKFALPNKLNNRISRKNDNTNRISLAFLILTIITLSTVIQCSKTDKKPLITVQILPYSDDALEPYISAETMSYHYGKHYAGYVEKANTLLMKSKLKSESIEEVIKQTSKNKKYSTLFNTSAQAWNHSFFWSCMKPGGGGTPEGLIAKKINDTFGSYDTFKNKFLTESKNLFGSGWVWLILDNTELKIITTGNADTPIAHGQTPLFTIDLWEHAYYLDYRNQRNEFIEIVLAKLIDWDFVSTQLKIAQNRNRFKKFAAIPQ
jgi:Fe-Mn family superoxide dismutase